MDDEGPVRIVVCKYKEANTQGGLNKDAIDNLAAALSLAISDCLGTILNTTLV